MAINATKRVSKRGSDTIVFLIGFVVIVLLNYIGKQFFFRLDLTEDKRYSIAESTKNLLAKTEDVVFVEVFLDGGSATLPPGFERLQLAVKETLEEFSQYSGGNIQYKFTQPGANITDQGKLNEVYQNLAKRGLQPTNLHSEEDNQRSEKIIFPGAIVSYGGREQACLFLKGNQALGAEQRLNQSIEGIEYELATTIKKLTQKQRKLIGIIKGHGELKSYQFNDMGMALKEFYDLDLVDLPRKVDLKGYDAIIIAKPDSGFSEPDKFKIDQFIIGGGKAMFFIDPIQANLDSIKPVEGGTLAFPYQLNLDDMFFKYGVRINPDMVLDIRSAYIPMVVGVVGDKPQTQMAPWRYFPIINNFANHPAVKNSDALLGRFVSSIDTVSATGITKTILATTSNYSRILASPVRLSFNEARLQPLPQQYTKKFIPLAVLLEGKFKSLYTNRLAPETISTFGFKAEDKPSKILIVSDGDFVRNEVNLEKKTSYPLGFDRASGVQFGNRDFVLNIANYMLDESGLILARNKQVQLRPLDKLKVKDQKQRYQVLNMLVPCLLIITFGLGFVAYRKRKYTKVG